MGQRLTIEIHENGKCLANAYYHWSAYTEEALELTRQIINYYPYRKNSSGLSAAIELLRKTGAGIMKDELINAGAPIELAMALSGGVNRDDGLISFTEDGMAVTRNWEEGRVTIDIGLEIIDFNCWCIYHDDEDKPFKVYIPFNIHKIRFNELKSFITLVGNVVDKEYHFCNNEVYIAIY